MSDNQKRCPTHGVYSGNVGCPFCRRVQSTQGVEILSSKGGQGGVQVHSKSAGPSDPDNTVEVRKTGAHLRLKAEDDFEYRKDQ